MAERGDIQWRSIGVEAVAIVGSILLAFAIDAWWENRQIAEDEIESLQLIQRDLESSIALLENHMRFSAGAAESALYAYKALSGPGPYDRERIHNEMLRVDRTTLKTPTAAYTDLLSTGNLRVIRNRELRDAIVRFYEAAALRELFIQNNNNVFLDRQLLAAYYGQGLIFAHVHASVGDDGIDEAYHVVRQRLGDDFVHKPDPMWSFEPNSREWQTLQALLLNAAQIHTIGELEAKEQIVEARKLLDSIDSWLSQN